MPEVGLVRFATVALDVARTVLPPYRTKFSKHTFTQPQLLAILCLMRYEDWTFRETEVRLAEHQELRTALGLNHAPDYTTLSRFLARLDETILTHTLAETVYRFPTSAPTADADVLTPRGGITAAVDATGLAPGAISTFFVHRAKDRGPFTWRKWTKWLVVADTERQLIVAQEAKEGPVNDCALLRPLVAKAQTIVPLMRVLADAEFDSERNHRFIREVLGADSIIPAKRGKATWRLRGIRGQMRAAFPQQLYRRRALLETIFSVAKRKLSARAPGRSLATQRLQALLLGVAYNLYRLKLRLGAHVLALAERC